MNALQHEDAAERVDQHAQVKEALDNVCAYYEVSCTTSLTQEVHRYVVW